MSAAAVVLAAGKGTRMKSAVPKVLHPICGLPMIAHVVNNLREAGVERILVVVGQEGQEIQGLLGSEVEYVVQAEQLGTGHAVLQAEAVLQGCSGPVLVIHGDTPLYRPGTLRDLIEAHQSSKALATVLSVVVDDPTGYGRIIRDAADRFAKIVEQKDAGPEEALVKEINSGTYVFECEPLFEALHQISPENAQAEYYLTDVLEIIKEQAGKVEIFIHGDHEEALGINNRVQLAAAERILRDRIRERWMRAGVTMVDPATTYVDAEAELAPDVVLLPFTFIEGRTRVAAGSVIGPFSRVKDCVVGENVTISQATVLESSLDADSTVGPYSYIRPGCRLAEKAKVGGFCEIKNTTVGPGSKVPHLTYLGDTSIGSGVNIGAGTITCNYDGKKKHPTVIDDGAFVGSNCNLVAPVEIGAGAYVAAGSTVTNDVPPGALGVARSRQRNIPDWVQRWSSKTNAPEEG
ncbi:MAG: bifunctional UDP-N-acetylglucosamine diphosphorylase/glucosamine-1-phosphate N-acetyltransferase GlmU [Firmicutes bacterium]|jgi:bifunctional UDP-N-acetylglucosamine pyrophosphorylase/glucosamine-1-phosphate N-acetyltransferase|nr:bifunctional UDP-N-acetylglucosamine diphosphorylase/glucosamine-1-phosphate N-acetyltransferase GlmU [Bacillota bacterium]